MGLQVLLSSSDENDGTPCLNAIDGKVFQFASNLQDPNSGERLKVPHMGWSQVEQVGEHALWSGIESNARFYFCHSYYVSPKNKSLEVARCVYGAPFTAVVAQDNIFACQFHPEKSAKDGLQLLANFSRWNIQG
jgi:glutamine amidotransferase